MQRSRARSTIEQDHWFNDAVFRHHSLKPIDAHCCHMDTPMKHPVPDRVKPSFVIVDIQALWRSTLSVRVPECQKLQMTIWHRILYSCTHMAIVGVKGFNDLQRVTCYKAAYTLSALSTLTRSAADFTAVAVDTWLTQTTSGHVITRAAIPTVADASTRRAVCPLDSTHTVTHIHIKCSLPS